MRLRLATTIAAVAALLTVGLAAPAAQANPVYDTNGPAVTVYNTPGGQIVNGRLWNTTCAKYSSSTVRCTTNIWASKITYANGKYTTTTGWVFNNLTYLPSVRAAWKTNPLGAYGVFKGTASWTSAGRKWRTECDTPATGTGACRSYTWSTYPNYSGGNYSLVTGWVFNNQVLFASSAIKPVTTIPAHVLDRARLTPSGWGPLQRISSMGDLRLLGYVQPNSEECGPAYLPTAVVRNRGVSFVQNRQGDSYPLDNFLVTTNQVRTAKGATVGMTIGQVKALHPELKIISKKGLYTGKTLWFAAIPDGNSELLFYVSDLLEDSIVYPADGLRVRSIDLVPYNDIWGWGGC